MQLTGLVGLLGGTHCSTIVTSSVSPQVTVGLPVGHVAIVIAQCWIPDQELEVAGELGGGALLLLSGKNTFFPLGKGHHATQGLAIFTLRLLSLDPRALKPQKERGAGY